MKRKYKQYTISALKKVLSKSKFKRLKPEAKIRVLQRIINYFYSYMTADILNDRKPFVKKDNAIQEVWERSLAYEYRS
jgi:hypothetical protein